MAQAGNQLWRSTNNPSPSIPKREERSGHGRSWKEAERERLKQAPKPKLNKHEQAISRLQKQLDKVREMRPSNPCVAEFAGERYKAMAGSSAATTRTTRTGSRCQDGHR